MPTDPPNLRPWQIIAKELVAEKDLKKILDLSDELTHALDEQNRAAPSDARKAS